MRGNPPRYVVRESEPYEIDRDSVFLSLLASDPGYAGRWLKRLGEVTNALAEFPGPGAHATEEAASDRYKREVRRLFYYGPTRRRSGVPVRILFTIFPPATDDPPETAESVILLLRLLHGRQVLDPGDPAEG